MKALAVDDNATNAFMLGKLVAAAGIESVATSTDPRLALDQLAADQHDLLICDYMMPGLDGLELIRAVRAMPGYEDVPIIMVTTADERAVCYEALEVGATDFLTKPIDFIEARTRIRNLAKLRRAQNALRDRAAWLADEVTKATAEMAQLEEEIILRLSRAAEYRDTDTGEHVLRMARICREIVMELGYPADFCRDLYLAAPMHDVGKIAVPDAILRKVGTLTPEERALMQTHTTIGADILAHSDSRLIRLAHELALTHHERWDGGGYPSGLVGEEIPISGRIAAVADVFDALVSPRPYKAAWSIATAAAFIHDHAGTQFDPRIVAAFEARLPAIAAIVAPLADRPPSTAASDPAPLHLLNTRASH
ncbi:HD-GYP domain-containing protein [Methylobrevis albus]|uniref:Response regulator n=1 Tax=Methylobrevis albus TaxID=2793297 RepID=A0A931I6S4_9HYPH|nr:HD domain-containing phosphohydrolase [Methylobrevis albus]MBH0239848.1 response regulator [Methylobrevis albus]